MYTSASVSSLGGRGAAKPKQPRLTPKALNAVEPRVGEANRDFLDDAAMQLLLGLQVSIPRARAPVDLNQSLSVVPVHHDRW